MQLHSAAARSRGVAQRAQMPKVGFRVGLLGLALQGRGRGMQAYMLRWWRCTGRSIHQGSSLRVSLHTQRHDAAAWHSLSISVDCTLHADTM